MPAVQSDYGFYRTMFQDKSTTFSVAAADSATKEDVIAPKSASHTVFVQRILLSVTTDAAKTLTFQDDASTPIVIAVSPASPGLGVEVVADFGPKGFALTEGKNLDVVISGAGLACQVNVEAYDRLTAVVAAGSTN